MAKIDLYDPKWIDMVFADRNKAYGAYKLRMGTSSRNIKALVILLVAAAIVGGFLIYKVQAQKAEEARQAYMEQLELSKLQEQAKKEQKKNEPKIQPKVEPKKEVPKVRETVKFTAPVIKKDELVKNQINLQEIEKKVKEGAAAGAENQEGTTSRIDPGLRNDIAVNVPPPAPRTEAPQQEVKQQVENKVFDVVEQMPSFPGGNGALMAWLSKNISYPAAAAENGIQGRVIVAFVVERDGSVTDVHTVRSVDPSLDREAESVVRRMPRWTPGKQNGQAVRVKYNVPVTFRLQQ